MLDGDSGNLTIVRTRNRDPTLAESEVDLRRLDRRLPGIARKVAAHAIQIFSQHGEIFFRLRSLKHLLHNDGGDAEGDAALENLSKARVSDTPRPAEKIEQSRQTAKLRQATLSVFSSCGLLCALEHRSRPFHISMTRGQSRTQMAEGLFREQHCLLAMTAKQQDLSEVCSRIRGQLMPGAYCFM